MMLSNNADSSDTSVISYAQLSGHDMKKYEFKKINHNEVIQKEENLSNQYNPSQPQISMIQSSLEKELIEKLLSKSDDLSNTLNSFQEQFEKLQVQSQEREKIAREEGYKEGEMKAKLSINDEFEKEREKITKSVVVLNETIENIKSQIVKLESELSTIALDIAKEVIIKEVENSSAQIALSISRELLQEMSSNLNIILKVNPLDFDFINNSLGTKENIKIKSDDAIAKGGIVIISDNGNVDGSVMSRYRLLKQSVLENFK